MFAPIYICPKHGEIWQVEYTEFIDTVNDEIYPVVLCSICFSEVTPLMHNGNPVLHPLTEEEIFWETQFNDEEDEINDD